MSNDNTNDNDNDNGENVDMLMEHVNNALAETQLLDAIAWFLNA